LAERDLETRAPLSAERERQRDREEEVEFERICNMDEPGGGWGKLWACGDIIKFTEQVRE
jgi:hypothetical protein